MTEISNRFTRRTLIGAAAGTAGLAITAVVGNNISWGKDSAPHGYPVMPYTLSAGAIEKFDIRERLHLSIDGIGQELVELTGLAVFRRHTPTLMAAAALAGHSLSWATAEVKVDFLRLETSGQSSLFGPVAAMLSAKDANGALVRPNKVVRDSYASGAALTAYPAVATTTAGNECDASIAPTVALSSYDEPLNLNGKYVQLASEVSVIPPVGDVARTSGTLPLYTSKGERVGQLLGADIEIGRVTARLPFDASDDDIQSV